MQNPDSSKSGSHEEMTLEPESTRRENEKPAPGVGGTPLWDQWASRLLPLLTARVAVSGFLFGIYQFGAQREDAEKTAAENRKKETEAERNRRAEADRLTRLGSVSGIRKALLGQ